MYSGLMCKLGIVCGFVIFLKGLLLPHYDRHSNSLFGWTLNPLLIALILLLLAVNILCYLINSWPNIKKIVRIEKRVISLMIFWGLCTSIGFYYIFFLRNSFLLWQTVPYIQTLLITFGSVYIALNINPEFGYKFWHFFLRFLEKFSKKFVLFGITIIVLLTSSFIGGFVLEGIPHANDATTYLIQGRALMKGKFILDVPKHPELFDKQRLKFKVTEKGFVGQYPPGWPLILGIFDKLQFRWLANPILLSAALIILSLIMNRFCHTHDTIIISLFFASNLFLLLIASHQLSHLASLLWLFLFFYFYIGCIEKFSILLGLASGSFLGLAILTRPSDALFFSIPCILFSLILLLRFPKKYFKPLFSISIVSSLCVLLFFYCNYALTGSASQSTYGKNMVDSLSSGRPRSLLLAMVWLHENISRLNIYSYLGTIPCGALLYYAVIFNRSFFSKLGLFIFCCISLLCGYSICHIFVENPWYGPRWLTPATALLAIAIAAAIKGAILQIKTKSHQSNLHHFVLNSTAIALCLIWGVVLPFTIGELLLDPPNHVSGDVVRAVQKANLKNAVLALPHDKGQTKGFYKDPKAGLWTMEIPFESNNVIYVSLIPNWRELARSSYPSRKLYWMNSKPHDYSIISEKLYDKNEKNTPQKLDKSRVR